MHNAITLLLVAKSRQKTGTLHRAPPSNRFAILVFFCGLFVLLLVRDHSHNGTQDVIMHEFPVLVAIPLLGVLFVLYWLWLCFCLLGSFVSGCVLLVSCWDTLDCVQVHYQYFCGYRQVDSLA